MISTRVLLHWAAWLGLVLAASWDGWQLAVSLIGDCKLSLYRSKTITTLVWCDFRPRSLVTSVLSDFGGRKRKPSSVALRSSSPVKATRLPARTLTAGPVTPSLLTQTIPMVTAAGYPPWDSRALRISMDQTTMAMVGQEQKLQRYQRSLGLPAPTFILAA